MPKTKICVVDDEPGLAAVVALYLRGQGYEVVTAFDGLEGLRTVRARQPELLILDISMPGLDGLSLLRRLRQYSNLYVIILTANAEEEAMVTSLTLGADDYLTKPFSACELLARVKAGLRRMQMGRQCDSKVPSMLIFRHLHIDTDRHQVWVDTEPVALTPTEFALLKVLVDHPGAVVTRQELLDQVWGTHYYWAERMIDVHIGHIRRKLGTQQLITTVRGIGYRFDDPKM